VVAFLPEIEDARHRRLWPTGSRVNSLSFRENTDSTTKTIDGITLVAKSVWTCVDVGVDQDVAAALYKSNTCGAAWNGAVSVPIADPWPLQAATVKFDRDIAIGLNEKSTILADDIHVVQT